jgi:uncharacterized C2H2 Zn-finger protein
MELANNKAVEGVAVAMDVSEDESIRNSWKLGAAESMKLFRDSKPECSAGNEYPIDSSNPSSKICDKNTTNTTPKRARLRLEVPTITVDKPKPTANGRESQKPTSMPTYSCPLCGWGTDVLEKITQHVNVAHLDALTPTKPAVRIGGHDQMNSNDTSPLECPLCVWTTRDSTALEQHVHHVHREDLHSPDIMSPDSLGSPLWSCPVCGMECSDAVSLQGHVDGHFSGTQTPGNMIVSATVFFSKLQWYLLRAATQSYFKIALLYPPYECTWGVLWFSRRSAAASVDFYHSRSTRCKC